MANDETSFEDSGMAIDDSMNASPFSKFAADNSHFQKIFSELFLGGGGLNDSENVESNRPQQNQENNQNN